MPMSAANWTIIARKESTIRLLRRVAQASLHRYMSVQLRRDVIGKYLGNMSGAMRASTLRPVVSAHVPVKCA